jgi:hypothetical protein
MKKYVCCSCEKWFEEPIRDSCPHCGSKIYSIFKECEHDYSLDSRGLYCWKCNEPYINKNKVEFDYIKCPLHRYTFSVKPMKEWTENNCNGKTLNLFAGKTKLNIDEVRNDLDPEALADYRLDAVEFLRTWKGEKFNTVLLDPPYAYRKSMEMYKGIKCSPFKQLKDEIPNVLKKGGKVITFGYHSNTMGKNRGFYLYKVGLFSHGGAIHDTIASVEIFNNN